MKNLRVKSFSELHRALERCRDNPFWIFRGQSNASWRLIPKAGRYPFNRVEDDYLFASWKADAIQYIIEKPRTDLEWLAVAQHHGLATRMLDWTRNPLVAAFFAVWDEGTTDAALFAFKPCEVINADYSESPFRRTDERKNVFVWFPDAISTRVSRQWGAFTIHEPPQTSLYILKELEELMCIRIDRRYRNRLREELSYYGITRGTLFPDLDGLASYHNWNIHYEFRDVPERTPTQRIKLTDLSEDKFNAHARK